MSKDISPVVFDSVSDSANRLSLSLVQEAIRGGKLKGDGEYARKCEQWLVESLGSRCALLTPSGTAALELAAQLIDMRDGDEVIVPSFTFTSTANAFMQRGARPVFAEIDPTTLTIDPSSVEALLSSRTKAISPVHYAGVACDMDKLISLARDSDVFLLEDAAHAIQARFAGRALGTLGQMGALSFHATKNVGCGEGGALLINDDRFIARARVLREKGTDRFAYERGEVARYTWIDGGSSYLVSELVSAYLYGQLQFVDELLTERQKQWQYYFSALARLESEGFVRLPAVPAYAQHNAHIFYLLCDTPAGRDSLLKFLLARGVHASFHYIPLHLSPMGGALGYREGQLPITEEVAKTIIRLPLQSCGVNNCKEIVRLIYTHFGQGLSQSSHEETVATIQASAANS